jgi:hypothetical protein
MYAKLGNNSYGTCHNSSSFGTCRPTKNTALTSNTKFFSPNDPIYLKKHEYSDDIIAENNAQAYYKSKESAPLSEERSTIDNGYPSCRSCGSK